ncbi:hypothetical protein HAX54_052007 [Datura stramonium]|uniref:Uncharacterized protein n=1 Tax=Datura stramonium TaxID=4076 RepID=A0ABS8WN45_DATST|nr:hypothetical protein [Datura stramonium]
MQVMKVTNFIKKEKLNKDESSATNGKENSIEEKDKASENSDLKKKMRFENMYLIVDEEVLNELSMENLVEKLRFQGWDHLFVCPMPCVHEGDVEEFCVNLEVMDEGRVKSIVHGVQFELS